MSGSDVTFTLDSKQFLAALDGMNKKMDSMANSADKAAKAAQEQADKTGVGVVAKGVLLAEMVSGLAQKAFSFVMSGIPEIGKAFEIAGDILKRNFLYPLRRELAPLLQGMLDWVRDHRAQFAQWGMFLVSIFRILKSAVGGLIDVIKGLWEKLAGGIERIFGKTSNSVMDIINLIIFKIAFMVQVAISLFGKIGDVLVTLFVNALAKAEAFFKGIFNGFGDIKPVVNDVVALFIKLKDMILGTSENSSGLLSVLQTIGQYIGLTLKVAIYGLIQSIDTLMLAMESMILLKKNMFDGMSDEEFNIKMTKKGDEYAARSKARGEDILKAEKGVSNYMSGNEANPTNNNSSVEIDDHANYNYIITSTDPNNIVREITEKTQAEKMNYKRQQAGLHAKGFKY